MSIFTPGQGRGIPEIRHPSGEAHGDPPTTREADPRREALPLRRGDSDRAAGLRRGVGAVHSRVDGAGSHLLGGGTLCHGREDLQAKRRVLLRARYLEAECCARVLYAREISRCDSIL